MGHGTGADCKAYYCEAGIGGTPVWTELGIAKNPSLDLADDEAVLENRESRYKRYLHGLRDAPLTLTITRKIGAAAYLALRNAFINRTVIGIAIASGDITEEGTEVFMADYGVFGWPLNEELASVNEVAIPMKPHGNSDEEPDYYDVEEA